MGFQKEVGRKQILKRTCQTDFNEPVTLGNGYDFHIPERLWQSSGSEFGRLPLTPPLATSGA